MVVEMIGQFLVIFWLVVDLILLRVLMVVVLLTV